MSASGPVRSARLVLERDLVAPLLSPWLVPRDLLELSTTSRSCLQAVRAGMEALNFEQYELSLTDADVITIVRCFPSLRSLTLCSSKITDISMGALATLSRLRDGRLHQNVDGILESHKELMRNLLEWVENQKQVPREVFDVLGVEPPNSDGESDSDQGTYRSSSSEDYF